MTEPITITSMSVKDFQGVHDISVIFSAGVTYISGANGSGKTSLMHSIAVLFFGVEYAGRMPIREGQKRAEITGTLSNGLTCRMVITPSGMTLTVTDATGLTKGTPRAILNKLMGSLAFDPLRFVTELNEKQQIAELKTICGLDFTELDKRRLELYTRRTDVNREAKNADAAFMAAPAWDATAPIDEINVSDLMASLKAARDHNAAIDLEAATIVKGEMALSKVLQRVDELTKELAAETAKAQSFANAIADRKVKFTATKQDTATIEQAISDSGAQNRKRTNNAQRDALMERATKWQAEAKTLSDAIDTIDATKSKTLAEAKMPIDGLSFCDDYVTWQGRPLSQASTREQIEVSFAICASLNPTLRAVIVPHGSLITPSNRPHFEAIAAKYGMQPLVELADESGEVPGIVISAGRVVRADNQTAMPADPTVRIALETKPAASPVLVDGPFA